MEHAKFVAHDFLTIDVADLDFVCCNIVEKSDVAIEVKERLY